ncbi:hypothetical protein SAMN03159341_11767 [Paenibacillus sp. 1_12]|uniref:hypothetical protein n=1 Tax=Paenibacillus sp. 1_12 TaxID=1566278 RepID=UPI0008EE3B13|nr:hypothetical protein [Paenibacillus sp. 1_12]SFM12765.1 hypothetical protein SAMN03159341_11767 [Paenibacillus sp. 1_12]
MLEQSNVKNKAIKSPSTNQALPIQQQPFMNATMQGSAIHSRAHGLSKENIIHMQRTVGNQAIQRMFSASPRTGNVMTIQRAAAAEAPEIAAEAAASYPIAAPAADVPAVVDSAAGAPVGAAHAAPAAGAPILAAPASVPAAGAPTEAAMAPASVPAPSTQIEAAPALAPAAGAAAPTTAGPTAAPSAAVIPPAARPAPTKDLTSYQNYNVVYKWLKERAVKEKKAGLFGYFDDLTAGEKMSAIKVMCGNERSPSIDKVKSTMLTGIFTKTIDWDRFSEISREAKAKNITNYNADQARDYAAYTAIGTSGATSGVSGTAALSNTLGAGGALSVANAVAPAAGVLSGVASVSQIYNASENYDSSLSAAGKAEVLGSEASGGAADLTRFTAGTVNGVRTLGGMAASGTATAAAGAAGVVGGAAYLAGGVAGYVESSRNQKKLAELEKGFGAQGSMNENDQTKPHQGDLGLAANLGGSTQAINKTKSAITAAKGALMIAGGAVMIAAALSPVGPILLAAAAILGGIGAIVKFYKKSKRKETFVDKALNIDKEMAKPENAGLSREKVRQGVLEAYGFNNVGQCYNQLVTDLASMLYEGGVAGQDDEAKSVIEGIGLEVNRLKKKPGKDLIAKKLHT